MDTFAALALATDAPTGSILNRKPEARTASLISLTMWKMILGQSVYQLVVCFVLWFGGPTFLDYPEPQLRTLVFNVFVFMQIFKLINSRRIDNKLNIFEGLHRNYLFILMMSIMVAGQLIIIFVGGSAFVVVRLSGEQWAMSVGLGFGSIPVGILIRLFPDAVLHQCGKKIKRKWPVWLRFRANKRQCDAESQAHSPEVYNAVFWNIRDDLQFLRRIRGGRIQALSKAFATVQESSVSQFRQSKSRPGSRAKERVERIPETPSRLSPLSPMFSAIGMPGIVAASVGGLSPVEANCVNK
jgi:Ca2+-transporting ATPase